MLWQHSFEDFTPEPDLNPQDVVKIQLDALQNNDLLQDDLGIRVAWRFASPANRAVIGTFERFIELVKEPYRSIMGFERAQLEQFKLTHNIARQWTRLEHRSGSVRYVFILSQQQQPPYAGCWMTDSLLLEA